MTVKYVPIHSTAETGRGTTLKTQAGLMDHTQIDVLSFWYKFVTLDSRFAVYVYEVPWSEFPIVPSYPRICSTMVGVHHRHPLPSHQQPEVNYLPRFSPQLISLERFTLSVYRAGEIDLFENLDIGLIRLLVVTNHIFRSTAYDQARAYDRTGRCR